MKRIFTLLLGTYLCAHASVGYAQFSSGLKTAATIISDNTIGNVGWSSPARALINDASRTTATAALLGDDTEYLMLTGFNVNVPMGMNITGIEIEVVKAGSNGLSYSVTDNEVRIVKAGLITGNNLAMSGKWPAADQTFTYGSSTENWGTTWTVADINDPGFGIAISAHLGGLLLPTAKINVVNVNVSYEIMPLPVTMISFNAKANKQEVNLSWATAIEVNNYGFTIQHSTDGNNWENIGEVLSHATSAMATSLYAYTDRNPYAGMNYYRLMQTDINNTIAYTTIVSVNSNTTINFSLYPNPANDFLHVLYSGKEKLQSITLIDLMGKPLQRYDVPEERQELLISTVDLLSGEYLISMASEKEVVYKRIMIGH